VDALEGVLEEDLAELWRWREEHADGEVFEGALTDGSRGGRAGMILGEELLVGKGV
jgi:hypothetical protein